MTQPFGYVCHRCGQYHEGMPSFGWDHPIEYLMIPQEERADRAVLTEDTCIIDDEWFFVRGCVEIPVHDQDEPLVWGMWVSLSRDSFQIFCDAFNAVERDDNGQFFGWLTVVPPGYPDTLLKTMVHLRPYPTRPYIELEPTDHPLAVEQREGISLVRVQEIAERVMHGNSR